MADQDTAADLEAVEYALMRPLTDLEYKYAPRMLQRVERQLKRRLAGWDDWIKIADNHETASDIESEAVARVFRNPDAVMSESDGTYSYSVNRLVASGLLSVLDSEWDMLGFGTIASVPLGTDGYVQARYPFRFQYDWPAHDDLATPLTGGELL